MRADAMGLVGIQTFTLRDKFGNVKKLWNENKLGKFIRTTLGFELRIPFLCGEYGEKMIVKNLVTTAGKALVAALLNGTGSLSPATRLALGTGTNAAAAGDTALQAEITDSGLERAAATCTVTTTTTTNDTAQLEKTFSATSSKAVTECGAFNADTGGVLLGRQVFPAINVADGDSVQITYKFVIS